MKKTFPFALASLLLILLFSLPPNERGGLWPLERMLQDLRTQSLLQDPVDGRIIIVDIDEHALQTLGRWPWDRDTIARLLHKLSEEGQAAVIGVDLLFPEPGAGDDALASLAERSIIFAQSFGAERQPPSGMPGAGISLHGVEPPEAMHTHSMVGITPALAEHAKIGHISPTIDPDGKIRYVRPLLTYEGRAYESLALAMMRDFLALPPNYLLRLNPNPFGSAYQLSDTANLIQLPLDAQGRLRLPFQTRTHGFLHVSAADVLHGAIPKDLLANRLILVGSSATGLGDLVATPVHPTHPAVQIHATLLQALLDRHFIIQPQATPVILVAILMLLVLIGEIALPRMAPLKGTAIVFALAALWGFLNRLIWSQGFDLPITPPLLLLATLLMIHGISALQSARGEKHRLVRQLGAYLPREVARQVIQGGDPFRPERRTLTVMFIDLRDFTAMAEGMEPEALAQLMDRYLSLVTRIIHHHGGTLDKYMGDGVMAFWGAPLANPAHAQAAYQAALDIAHGIDKLSQSLISEGLPPLRTGIGLHTGSATVGNLGTRFRHAYTALGDTVNLASRIEGLTRALNKTILLSGDTARQLRHAELEDLGLHHMRGRREPVRILAPAKLARANAATPPTPGANRPESRAKNTPGIRRVLLPALLLAALSLPAAAQHEPAPHVDMLYQQALAALHAGQNRQAIELLERLIILQPNHAGAHLDLALAYRSDGDLDQAERILDRILNRFDPPPAIRLLIERQRQSIRDSRQTTAPADPTLSLHQALGYASNVNAGPRERGIEIDLGYGPIELQLDESSRPQGDHYSETGLRLQHTTPWHLLRLDLTAQADLRRHARLSIHDTDFLHAGMLLTRPPQPLGWDIGLSLNHLRLNHTPYLNGGILALGLQWRITPHTTLHTQLQSVIEDYPGDPVYDARLWRARFGADWNPAPAWRLALNLEWESDQAQNGRAGGDRQALSARLAAAHRLGPDSQMELAARALERQDQAPYSPLLFGDTHRTIRRQDITAIYSHRLPKNLIASLEMSARRDHSTIDLFTQDNWQAELKLTWRL